ncbi:hemagglutinin repeat-containing protein [Sphingomonas yunnanensis]|uniref:two-partner secretion domain-containing protein n=1 Tax=Sphingomonas yunnanensis TaxID=310400 RepID=UPI001CA6743C|nr:hemagglutinin repeat-containing protein [Sphingomonas yunnanensis]MBY9063222.1 hemagglutinin repeat-containing protein [Sphingomonas yunnanensis]
MAAALATSALSPAVSPACAQTTAPITAPPLQPADRRTALDVTPAGTPIVNIAAPDKNGTSYNVYNSFSVSKEGLILNNSPVVDRSTIGGMLLANPHLADGQNASLVLNEVTGGARSTLAGPIEMFGKQAAFVLANPSGITCDGCGFLNMSRVSLAAAQLQFGGESTFTGFAKSGADVTTEGKGLLAGNVDYVDIIAAVTHINAAVYARDLVIAAGSGTVDYATRAAAGAGSDATGVALDSSALGGMYANRIRLIGTGAGLGINLVGTVAALDGSLAITGDGAIAVAKVSASGDATIASSGAVVTLTDQFRVGGAIAIDGASIVQRDGVAAAARDVDLRAAQGVSLAGKGVYAGVDSSGRPSGAATLTVRSGGVTDVGSATLAAGGGIAVTAAGLRQAADGQIVGAKIKLTADEQHLAGAISSSAETVLRGDVIDLTGTLHSAGSLALSADRIHLGASALVRSESAVALSGTAIALSGSLAAYGALHLSGRSITLGTTGVVRSGDDIAVVGDAVDLSGDLQASGALALSGGHITLSGSAIGLRAADARADDSIEIASTGHFQTNGGVTLSTPVLVSAGIISGGAAASFEAMTLVTTGIVATGGDLSVTVQRDAMIGGKVSAACPVAVTVGGVATLDADLRAGTTLRVDAGALAIGGVATARDALTFAAARDLTVSAQAQVGAQGDVSLLAAGTLALAGTVATDRALTLTAASIDLAGAATAGSSLALRADTLALSGRAITDGGATVEIAGQFRLSGSLSAGTDLGVAAASFVGDDGGQMLAARTLAVLTPGSFEHAGGLSGEVVTITADRLVNGGRLIAAETMSLAGVSEIVQAGLAQAGTGLSLVAPRIGLVGETIVAHQGPLGVRATTLAFAPGADLESGGTLSLSSVRDLAIQGRILTLGAATISSQGALWQGGAIESHAALDVTAGTTLAQAADVKAAGPLTLTAPVITNSGAVASGGALSLRATDMLASSGSLLAHGDLTLGAPTLDLSGTTTSDGLLTLDAPRLRLAGSASGLAGVRMPSADLTVTSGGALQSGDALALDLTHFENEGLISSARALHLAVDGDAVNAGQIVARTALDLAISRDLASSGVLQGGTALTAAIGGTAALSGALSAGGDATLSASSLVAAGTITTDGALSVTVRGEAVFSADSVITAKAGLSATSATFDLAGSLRSGSTLDLAAAQDLVVSGGFWASGASTLRVGGTASVAGRLTSGGPLRLDASAVSLSGRIAGHDQIAITASGTDLDLAGTIQATEDVALTAVRRLTIGRARDATDTGAAAPSASSAPDAPAPATQRLAAPSTASGSNDSGTAIPPADGSSAGSSYMMPQPAALTPGTLATDGKLTLSAADIDIAGSVTARGDLAALASHVLTVSGQVWSDGSVDARIGSLAVAIGGRLAGAGPVGIAATQDITQAGTLASRDDDVRLTYAGRLDHQGTTSAGKIFSVVTGADYTAAGSVAAEQVTIDARDLVLSGKTVAGGELRLTGRTVTFAGGSLTESGGTMSIAGVGAVDLSGRILSASDVSVTAGGALGLGEGADLGAGGALRLRSDQDLTAQAGSTALAKGALAFTAKTIALAGRLSSDASAELTARNGMIVGGKVTALGDVSVEAARDLAVTGTIASARGLALRGGNTRLMNGAVLQAGGELRLTAASLDSGATLLGTTGVVLDSAGALHLGGAVTAGTVDGQGVVTALADLTVRGDDAVVFDGVVNVTGRGSVTTGALDLGGTLVTLGDVALDGATLATRGTVTANGAIAATIRGNAALGGTLIGLTGIDVTAGGSLTQAARLGANGAIALAAGGVLTHIGTSQAQGKIALSGASLQLGGVLRGGSMLALAATGGGVTLAPEADASAASVSLSATGDAAIRGRLAATHDLATDIGGTLTLATTGVLRAGVPEGANAPAIAGTMVLHSGGVLDNAGLIASTGSITFDVPRLVNSGTISTGTDVTLSAASLSLGGSFISAGDITLSATAGTLEVAGELEGRNLRLSASGGDLDLGSASSLRAVGSGGAGKADLTATGAIDALGTIAANGDVTVEAGTSLHLGKDRAGGAGAAALSSAGNVRLTAGGALTDDGTVAAQQDLSVAAASLTSATLAGGTLSVTTAGDITLTGMSFGRTSVVITSTRGDLALASGASLQSDGRMTVSAAGDVTNAGSVSAGMQGAATPGAISITTGGALRSTGAILSNNDSVTLTAATLTLGGALSDGGGVYAAGALTLRASAMTLADGGQAVGNGGVVAEGATLTLGKNGLLQSNQDLSVALKDGQPSGYTSTGQLVALGDLSLTVAGGTIANGGGAGIFAGGAGSIARGGSITLSATALDNGGQVVASAAADGSKGAVAITAGTIASGGLIHADRTLRLATAALTVDGGVVEAGDALDLRIATVQVAQGAALRSSGDVKLSGASLTNGGAILSGGALAVASSGDLISSGVLQGVRGVALASGTRLTLAGFGTTLSGDAQESPAVSDAALSLAAPTIDLLGAVGTTGTLGIKADRVTVGGSVAGNGDVTLAGFSGGAAPALAVQAGAQLASYLGSIRLGTLSAFALDGTTLASQGDVALSSAAVRIGAGGRLLAGRDAQITASGSGAVAIEGAIGATRDISLAGGTLTLASGGAINAGHDLTFVTADTVAGTGPVTVNDTSYDVTATPISARIAGKLSAGHDLTLTMPGALIVDGSAQIVATHDLALTAGHAVIGARYTTDASGTPLTLGVLAGHDLRFANSSSVAPGRLRLRGLALDGSMQAGATLRIDASGEMTSTGAAQLVAGNGLFVSGSAMQLAGLNSGQNSVRFVATGATPAGVTARLTPGDVLLSGATASGGRISLSATTATITAGGSLTAGGGAANRVAVARDIGAAANIDIETGGTLTNKGAIWSDGAIFLTSAGGDVVNEASGANGGITAKTLVVQVGSGGFLNRAGAFKAADTGLFLGGDFVNGGSLAPSGNYRIEAANIRNSGLLATSGNLTLVAAGDLYNVGTLYAGQAMSLTAGRTLTNDYVGDDQGNGAHGLILAQGDIAISAHDVLNQSATIQSLGGSVDITLKGGSFFNTIKSLIISPVPGSGAKRAVMPVGNPPVPVNELFNRVGCGWSGTLQNGARASFKCISDTKVLVSYSGCGASAEYYLDYEVKDGPPSLAVTANTGTATILSSGHIHINAVGGKVVNRNSSVLAGGDITIEAGDTVTNMADLLATNTDIGGTRSLENSVLPGAPTIIQAGGTVTINAATFNNVANNLVGPDTFTVAQKVEHAAPGRSPAGAAPDTGSTGNNASASTSSATGAKASSVAVPDGNISARGVVALTGRGAGAALNTARAHRDRAGFTALGSTISGTGGSVGTVAALDARVIGSTAAPVVEEGHIGAVADRTVDVAASALTSGTVTDAPLAAGNPIALNTPAGAPAVTLGASPAPGVQGAAPLVAGLVTALNGANLPTLSDQPFGTFLGQFLASLNLTSSNASLFTYSDNPSTTALFSTNKGLQSEAELYDSGYFFQRVAPDRATTYARLGDGFLEAMLVTREVQAATGHATLREFGTALDQYQHLLWNAADQQAGLGLHLGVGLTPEQVAKLTAPMVWYVSTRIGDRDVLVPVVYLAASDPKAISGGALIDGGNVAIATTAGITNSGTLRASQIVALSASGGDIVNASGGTIAGGTVVAKAAHDIVLQGGSTLVANGYALPGGQGTAGGVVALQAGHDISSGIVKASNVAFADGRVTSTEKITGATIQSSAGTQLVAGNDIALNAAGLTSKGSIALAAAGDVTLGGSSATTRSRATTRRSSETDTSTRFTGTTLDAVGPVSIAAGGTLDMIGSSITTHDKASGWVDLSTGKGITIAAAEETWSASRVEQTGKRSSVTSDARGTTHQLSGIDAAGGLGVETAGALVVRGGTLISGGALDVQAGSLAVTGVIDSVDSHVTAVSRRSGLLSSQSRRSDTTTHQEQAVASTLSGEMVTVLSKGAVHVTGSNVVGSNGVDIDAAGTVTIDALATHDRQDVTQSVRKSGVSLGGGGLFVGAARTSSEAAESDTRQHGALVGTLNGDLRIRSDGALSITGSQTVAGGHVGLQGSSVVIDAALESSDAHHATRSSSLGVTLGVQSQLLQSAGNLLDMGGVAARTGNARVAAVAGLAGGMAAVNAAEAGQGLVDALGKGSGDLGASVVATFGVSRARASDSEHDEHVMGSEVQGRDVTIVATGPGATGTVDVHGSRVRADTDLAVGANGKITVEAAVEQDRQSGRSRSSGATLGVTAQVGLAKDAPHLSGPTVSAGVSSSRGGYAGETVTNVDGALSAGGTATVITPGALVLDGGTVSGRRVVGDVGSLEITSRQDTSRYDARSRGVSGSIGVGGGVGSLSGNVSSGRQLGAFASVGEQSGIYAGDGGYSLRVAGDTTLVGGVIASTAEESKNSLTTRTLHASDLENSETWRARQVALGGGIGGIGADRAGQAGPGGATPLPGVPLGGLGRLSAAVPVALGAGGEQSSVTRAAISAGAITLTSGDAASRRVAETISRDPGAANAGALRRQFTDTKRQEVADGFWAAQVLTSETGAFFAKKGQDEADLRAQAKKAKERGDPKDADRLTQQADQLHERYGAGSAVRLVATGLGGAAGGDVTGSLGGLARASAVNVLQGLAATQVKRLADGLRDGDGAATLGSEAARAGLHAVVGCAGQAAGGAGDCGSAALGAASAVVLNDLLSRGTTSATDADGKPLTLAAQQAREQLVATLVAAGTAGAGLDAHGAVTSAQVETENNSLEQGHRLVQPKVTVVDTNLRSLIKNSPPFKQALEHLAAGHYGSAEEIAAAYDAYASCLTAPGSSCHQPDDPLLDTVGKLFDAAAQGGLTATVTTLLTQTDPALVARLASVPGATTASSYTGEIGATLEVTTRLPGPWGRSAEAGVLGGATLALGMAELAPLPPTLIHTPGLGNIGTSAIDPDDRARGQFEAFPTVTPQGVLPGFTPDFSGSGALPGYGLTTPVESGNVLTNASHNPSYTVGESDGGPGTWVKNGPFGKPADQCYQCQVTGAPPGIEYQVNGVHFDGYDPKTNTLIDAKNYADWPIDKPFSSGSVLKQAEDQVAAAKGTGAKIEWRVATRDRAESVQNLFARNGIIIQVSVEAPEVK